MGWFWSSSSPVLPVDSIKENKQKKKETKRRYMVQRLFETYMKKLKSQILKNPFSSKEYTVSNAQEMDSRLIVSVQQLEQLVSNQKVILDLSLQILQCQQHYSTSSVSFLSKWEENTRDLFTHFDLVHKQQEDLMSLQWKDLRYLQKTLDSFIKNKKCKKTKTSLKEQATMFYPDSSDDSSDSFDYTDLSQLFQQQQQQKQKQKQKK